MFQEEYVHKKSWNITKNKRRCRQQFRGLDPSLVSTNSFPKQLKDQCQTLKPFISHEFSLVKKKKA